MLFHNRYPTSIPQESSAFFISVNGSITSLSKDHVPITNNINCGYSSIYGTYTIMNTSSFITSKLNNMDFSYIDHHINFNKLASDIATKLDKNNKHIIIGDCYFIFDTNGVLDDIVKIAGAVDFNSRAEINNLPTDILIKCINKKSSMVCTYWSHIWRTKPLILNLTTNKINLIPKFRNIIGIKLGNRSIISEKILNFTRLQKLCINTNTHITDEIFKNFTSIIELELHDTNIITDKSLKFFTNLTSLAIHNNNTIIGTSFKYLTNITSLNCENSDVIKNKLITNLDNIIKLQIKFGDGSNIDGYYYDSDYVFKKLIHLKKLHIIGSNEHINFALEKLTNLDKLKISYNRNILFVTLQKLSNLKSIIMDHYKPEFSQLSNLRTRTHFHGSGL